MRNPMWQHYNVTPAISNIYHVVTLIVFIVAYLLIPNEIMQYKWATGIVSFFERFIPFIKASSNLQKVYDGPAMVPFYYSINLIWTILVGIPTAFVARKEYVLNRDSLLGDSVVLWVLVHWVLLPLLLGIALYYKPEDRSFIYIFVNSHYGSVIASWLYVAMLYSAIVQMIASKAILREIRSPYS